MLSAKVCEYWMERVAWKWTEFTKSLPSNMLLKLASVFISSSKTVQYKPRWEGTSGMFMVGSAHEIQANWSDSTGWVGWLKVGKLKTQEQVKTFGGL